MGGKIYLLKFIFWGSIGILGYTCFGYYMLLAILTKIMGKEYSFSYAAEHYPIVSVIVSAFNEEDVIERRIMNLLESDYPKEKIEIVIVSDGSDDTTIEKAKKFLNQRIKVLEFREHRGRASTHTAVAKMVKGEILVLTDADTIFKKDCVKNLVLPFSDPKIGCIVGKLIFKAKNNSRIAEAECYYWDHELRLRKLESRLGILSNGTGACMAIRKELCNPLTPVDDYDFATTIDMVLKGYKAVFNEEAIAYDIPPHSIENQLKARIRVTSKTLMSLARRTNFMGWLKHPVLAWSILSRRVLRYLTAYFILVVLISNLFLLDRGVSYQIIFAIQMGFFVFVILGWLSERFKIKIPIASIIFSFAVAILAMASGVVVALMGRAPIKHKLED